MTPTPPIPVIAVVGPTASGKTALAVELAKRVQGEIVSADSMQIYQGMKIATAKPTPEETDGVVHHLIDFLPPSEKYSAADYQRQAGACIRDICERHKQPIVCGGTGLYIDSLLRNMVFEEEPDNTQIRRQLEERRQKEGIESLLRQLVDVDPETAANLHPNNEGRIIRALEIWYLTGEKPSVRRKRALCVKSPYEPLYIGLDYKDRKLLYDRIDLRVDKMLEEGLLEEARQYFALDKKCTASQAIGYKELAPYFEGTLSLSDAVQSLKFSTHHYAKRQLTWFRKNPLIHWLYKDTLSDPQTLAEAIKIIGSELTNVKSPSP